MIDAIDLAQIPRNRPLRVKQGPAREASCVIRGCPIDEHGFVVKLPGAGLACPGCAEEHGFEIDWSHA